MERRLRRVEGSTFFMRISRCSSEFFSMFETSAHALHPFHPMLHRNQKGHVDGSLVPMPSVQEQRKVQAKPSQVKFACREASIYAKFLRAQAWKLKILPSRILPNFVLNNIPRIRGGRTDKATIDGTQKNIKAIGFIISFKTGTMWG